MAPMRAADLAQAPAPSRGLIALGAVAAVVVFGFTILSAIRPEAARTGDVPPGEFSAGRAYEQVQAIATRPHPAGSAANDQVRDYLLSTLRSYRLSPEVQDAVSVQGGELSANAGGVGLARVRNVVARIPGSDPTGQIVLVAHYDSVQTGPGGNDDAAGVSTILEVARALGSGPLLRNDIVLVLTDGEEACLCGAQAFVDQNPLGRAKGVVLNVEARGSSGPAIMFETSKNNAKLVELYGRTPRPVGTSFAVEIYRLMTNDTDFSAFRDAGWTGLNSAYIDGAAVYHAPTDQPATMNRDSLQQHGDNTLALARSLGDLDLATTKSSGDATYFPVPWGQLSYPGLLVWPIAALAALAVAALGWLARRRGLITGRRLAVATASTLIPIIVAPVLAQVFWRVLTLIRPGYAALPLDPYHPFWYRLAVLALTAVVIFAWYALLRRRLGPAAMAIAGLIWLAGLGLVLALAAPGGSYLTALPALAGALAAIIGILIRRAWVPMVLGPAVGVIVLLPMVVLLFPALGLVLAGVGAFLAVLLGLAVLPVVDLLHPEAVVSQGLPALRARRRGLLPTALAAIAVVVFTATGLRGDAFDAAHPAPTQLMYALNADDNTAQWLSAESVPQKWTAHYVGDKPVEVVDKLPAFGEAKLLTGPATAAALPAPQLTVEADTRSGDSRTLRLRLAPQRPVRLVTLHVAAQAKVSAAIIGGREVPVGKTAGGGWGFGFIFHAPPSTGVEVQVTLTAPGPVKFRVMDASDGLTSLPGFVARPADVGVVGSHISDLLAVTRTYTF